MNFVELLLVLLPTTFASISATSRARKLLLLVIYTQESSKMANEMALGGVCMKMEESTKVLGLMANGMVWAQ